VDRFHPGVHRLVLHACDRASARYEGLPFEMAASARELWRWRASAGIQRGQVFRLDPHGLGSKSEDRPPEYIAGFRDALVHCGLGTLQELNTGINDRDTPYDPGTKG